MYICIKKSIGNNTCMSSLPLFIGRKSIKMCLVTFCLLGQTNNWRHEEIRGCYIEDNFGIKHFNLQIVLIFFFDIEMNASQIVSNEITISLVEIVK